MLGPCYFVNVYALIFIWGVPYSAPTFLVLFGLANSTVYSAIILFRNSFVFHNYDKMTSCFIHILPPLISYCVQTLIWVGLNIVVNFVLNLIALLAWCSFVFHSLMIVAMVVVMSWYGASYYLDYFAYLALRKAIENNEVPAPVDSKSPTEMEDENDEYEEVDE
ncbi:unnamed protein product, partial [Hydatigera taeniaeformis]|uniref:Glycerophosphocholine acyltransferase 1 n=1 Tax=Hydatigena taeniaeformis TaxID=6205 RepID=A0A0R3XAU9_HYDTA